MAKRRQHIRLKPNPVTTPGHDQEPFFVQTKPAPEKEPKPAPKPEPDLLLNGQPFYYANAKGEPVSLTDATAGSMAWKDATGKTTEGAVIRLKSLAGHYAGVFNDPKKNTFSDKIMQGSGPDLSPVPYASLPSDLRSGLGESSVINLDNGKSWDLMSFHIRGEKKDTARWVPGVDTRANQTQLGEQSENLPDPLREQITPELTTMAAVSTIEGSFGATSGSAKDDTGSLGIFQWGMKKVEKDNTSSLALFFKKLKQRATAAPAAGATDEQQLYLDAWKACKDKGLDVDASGFITLHGRRATGAEVETAMHGVMGSNNSLRTYQLVAGHDWIQDFKTNKVWPGPAGEGQLGHGFSYGRDSATFTPDAKYRVDLSAPDTASTVGDYFTSDKALSMAVMLGVNRPHWVSWAIWRALNPGLNPRTKTDELLKALISKIPDSSAKHVTIDLASATAAGDEALAAYKALQIFLWPESSAVTNEDAFIAEFQRQALALYKPDDMNSNHREHRFSTVEAAFHE